MTTNKLTGVLSVSLAGLLIACLRSESLHQSRDSNVEPKPEAAMVPATYFGRIVAAIPDCDRDGVTDYAVGMARIADYSGSIRVFSGRSGEVLFDLHGKVSWDLLGGTGFWPLAGIDKNGSDEMAAGIKGPTGSAAIISLRNRAILFELDSPIDALTSCLDLDGDRCGDLLSIQDGAAKAFSGVNGRAIAPPVFKEQGPLALARMIQKGGNAIVVILKQTPDGSCLIYDSNKSLDVPINQFKPSNTIAPCETHPRGASGLWIADLDADGAPDLIQLTWAACQASSTEIATPRLTLTAMGSASKALIFRSTWKTESDRPPIVARCLALSQDLNGDGVPDMIVGNPSWFSAPGGVRAISGRDGSQIWTVDRLTAVGTLEEYAIPTGVSVDVLSDIDGDFVSDVVVGCGFFAYDQLDSGTGAMLILSGRTGATLRRVYESEVR